MRRIVRLGAGALQDMQLERGEGDVIETQRFGAVRQRIGQIGARPVEDRHEVVADGVDAAGREVAQRLLIVGDMPPPIAAVGFDLFMYRHALHHRPHQPFFRQQRLPRADLVDRPDFAVRNMVQRRDHPGRPGLTHVIQRDRIVRAIPTPCLFHVVSLCLSRIAMLLYQFNLDIS